METTVLTREMVALVHSQGKEICGWTANSLETIEKNLRCGVDGIVADNPKLVKQYAMQRWDSRLLNAIRKIFFDENVK
ncbi:glycerophosphodiester phosphodiesterase family protein [Oscillibacter sp. PC13]|uniref:glycerophosphodiester phosphodiesterase family protein n=1 Tax=Oscillibacter sp. PC13 TaxID=1855299 RepID=UPI000B8138BD